MTENPERLPSYSQNAEDVRLWRVFGDGDPGFYVDVGAGDPTLGSVTRLFYDRGWHGINIEPGPMFARLEQARTRDINLNIVVGDVDGETEFLVTYPDAHLSSSDPEILRYSGDRIERTEKIHVPQRRLASVLAEHASDRAIDFLKVDVEGAEQAVLASSDWSRFRPRVVLVEAILPWSRETTEGAWEHLLTGNGYIFVTFDGINRFYVGAENAALADALAYPISALDHYVSPAERQAAARTLEIHSELDSLRLRARDWALLEDRNRELQRRTSEAEARTRQAETRLRRVLSSRSWRVATAMRRLARPIRPILLPIVRTAARARKRRTDATTAASGTARAAKETGGPPRGGDPGPLRGIREAFSESSPEAILKALSSAIERTERHKETVLAERKLGRSARVAVLDAEIIRVLREARSVETTTDEARSVETTTDEAQAPRARRTILVDARGLQADAGFSANNVQQLVRAIARSAAEADLLVLSDPALPPVPEDLGWSPARTITSVDPREIPMIDLFVEPAPMTTDPGPVLPLLLARGCHRIAIAPALGGEDPSRPDAAWIADRAKREALSEYDTLLTGSEDEMHAALAGRRAGARSTSGRKVSAAPGRRGPRIAVVTPLPPQRTGVGDYSAATVRAMAAHADIDLYTNEDATIPNQPGVALHPYAIDPYVDRRYDAVISVLGNSHFHVPILEYFHELGGACIAHDPWMAGITAFMRGPAHLADMLSAHSAERVRVEDIASMLDNPDLLPGIAYDEIAPRARPLLVHSDAIAARIRDETGVEPIVLPYVPHRVPRWETLTPDLVAEARSVLGWNDNELHIVTLGIVHRLAKASDLLLDALGWLHRWGVACSLHFVGSATPTERDHVLQRAAELEIVRHVHLDGWASDDEIDQYLLASDAAIQLRTYARAPLSGALLDCAAFGVPSVTTAALASEMRTPSYITATPDALTPQSVAEALAGRLAAPRVRSVNTIEDERRSWLGDRTTDVYARRLFEALGLELAAHPDGDSS